VLLVDRSDVVGDQLGPGPRAEIESALDELRIDPRLGTTVSEVCDGYAVLSDGTRVEADAVVWAVWDAGQRAHPADLR
jgi:NADH:ubiquinone reductase (H+-translocating)